MIANQTALFVLASSAILNIITLPLLRYAGAVIASEFVVVAVIASSRGIFTFVRIVGVGVDIAVKQLVERVPIGYDDGAGFEYGFNRKG